MSKTAAEWTADGIAFKNTKEMGKAVECFDKAIDADPNFGEAYYWKAFINDDDSKLAEEAALYEKAISLGYTQNHMVFYCMGVALGKLKRKEEAIAAYEKSSALNPNHFSSYNNKGNAQMVLGRVEDAIEAYRMSIKINPVRLDVYEGLGPLLEEIGQKEEALKAYDEGLQQDPNDLMVNLSKGTLLTEMERYDDAIKCFEAALTKNNNAIVTNYRMGNALLACGKEEEAKQHYTVTTKQNPTSSWGYCVRGQCYYRLGMKTEAFEDFKKTKEMFAKEEGLLNWTPKQVKFIKETLHSLLESEDASGKAANIIESLDANSANNPTVKKFITKMKKLQEDKDKAQSTVITQMAKRANDSVNTNLSELDKIREEFQNNLEEMKRETAKLQSNMGKIATEWTAEGIVFKDNNEMTNAGECFVKAITADPNFGEAYYWKAFINDDDSRLVEEVLLYEKAISLGYNQNHMVFYCLGVALGKLKRKAEAITAYEKSHALNPNHFSSFNNKGNAQMVLGRIEDAIEAFKIAIKINPARLDVYEGLGPLLEEIGQKEEALKVYDEGLQRDPTDLIVNLSKGTLLTELGRYDDAIKCFEAALTKNNNAIVTNYRMGNALLACGKEEEAKQHYTVTTKQNPTSSWGYCVRGQCFYRLGMKTEAFEDFKKTRDMFAKEEGLLNWTPKQVKFIKETVNSLLDSEDASDKATNIIDTLDANNPTVKKFITKMKKLLEDKNNAQDIVITQMEKRASIPADTNLSELDKIREEFQNNLEEMNNEISTV